MGRLNPPQLLILSFLLAILAGTAALSLPIATHGAGRLSLVDSLFTATSATCVTGLVVRDTGSYFSGFGRGVIFTLFQAGGLGIMTFSTLFAVILGRKIGFIETDVIRGTLDKQNILGLRKLITYILGITAAIELTGAAFLFFRWRVITEWGVAETMEKAIFHAVSGFCNAGFSLFSDSLTGFKSDPGINITMMMLIFFGGIGFIVIMDMLGLFSRKNTARKISLQSKIALTASLFLIAVGTILLLIFESDGIMAAMTWTERMWGALFQSVTARTAGFNTMNIGKLSIPSLAAISFLMFVGASPGSTGGGIKTCTFFVIAATVLSMMRNKKRVSLFSRSIPRKIIREAMAIFFLSAAWIFVFTLLLGYFERGDPRIGVSFMGQLFEVVSAFGTVGLSTGITDRLSDPGKLCLIATMFAGRVGPLTLALAVAFRMKKDNYFFPEENVMVG